MRRIQDVIDLLVTILVLVGVIIVEIKVRPTFMSFPVMAKGRTIGETKTTIRIGLRIIWDLFEHDSL